MRKAAANSLLFRGRKEYGVGRHVAVRPIDIAEDLYPLEP